MKAVWFLVSILAGAAVPAIVQMNLRVSRSTGDVEASVLLHAIGAVGGVGWMLVGFRGAGFSGAGAVPAWAWLAGLLGVTGMAATNRAIPHIGVAAAITVSVAAQLVVALAFEQWGLLGAELRPVTLGRGIGASLLVVGAWLVSR